MWLPLAAAVPCAALLTALQRVVLRHRPHPTPRAAPRTLFPDALDWELAAARALQGHAASTEPGSGEAP